MVATLGEILAQIVFKSHNVEMSLNFLHVLMDLIQTSYYNNDGINKYISDLFGSVLTKRIF